ncbi:hypothetical protein, partial [Streptomyces anulatus]|uniref:hypothetical protein n=1 Tax=Streptomyces anulatus TaxID=1892 RepID=UPI0036DE4777
KARSSLSPAGQRERPGPGPGCGPVEGRGGTPATGGDTAGPRPVVGVTRTVRGVVRDAVVWAGVPVVVRSAA